MSSSCQPACRLRNVKAGTGSNNVIPGDCFVQFNPFQHELTDEMIKARVIALLEKYQLRYTTVDWWLSASRS